jgi:hypothetical protein
MIMIVRLGARRIVCRLLCAMVLLAAGAVADSSFAVAAPAAQAQLGKGLDSCTAPSLGQMNAFWKNTPYTYWGIYIGGSTRGCRQPNLTADWVRRVTAQGWALLPIWVGPQNPCQKYQSAYFSRNTKTAYAQGKHEAVLAYKALHALGLPDNSPVDYDLEASGGKNSAACEAATKSFIQGWVNQLHEAPAQRAGVYTSSCNGFLDKFAALRPDLDFIDGASWDRKPSTMVMPCVSSSHWNNHARHKQYLGGHAESWNKVRLNVDSRCGNSYVAGNTGLAYGRVCS